MYKIVINETQIQLENIIVPINVDKLKLKLVKNISLNFH